jgi:uncharacterized membrane protein
MLPGNARALGRNPEFRHAVPPVAALRKYLIAGLLVWLPLMATVAIVKLVVDLMDRTLLLLPAEYRPEALFGFSIPGLGIVLALVVLILTGVLAANLLGRELVGLWEGLLNRIPLVRNIYNAAKQIASTVLTSDNRSFRKVVLVEYPRPGIWCLGFLSNDHVRFQADVVEPRMVSVFIPTTPNPTSGFNVMLPPSSVTELTMTVEEGFKFIISMGVVVPEGPVTAAARVAPPGDGQ